MTTTTNPPNRELPKRRAWPDDVGNGVLGRLMAGTDRSLTVEEVAAALPVLAETIEGLHRELEALRRQIAEGVTTKALTIVHPETGQRLIWSNLRDTVTELFVAAPWDGAERRGPHAFVSASFGQDAAAGFHGSIDGNPQVGLAAVVSDEGDLIGWLNVENEATDDFDEMETTSAG